MISRIKIDLIFIYKDNIFINNMSFDKKIIITVKPIWENDITKQISYFYDEMGTPVFYMVSNILKKHLGDDIWVYLENTFLFDKPSGVSERLIKSITKGDCLDIYIFNTVNIEKIKQTIEKINELHTLIPIFEEHMPSAHIKFEIINISVESN